MTSWLYQYYAQLTRSINVPTADEYGVIGGIPGWLLAPNGIVPALDIDFVNNRAWQQGPAQIANLLTCARASSAYYTTAGGILVSVQPNLLRYGDAGLLVEESRTNVVAGSQSFTGGNGWTIVSATMTNNAAAAPDGTTTAATLVEAAATSDHVMIPGGITVAVNTQISCSVYVKQAPGTRHLWMSCYDAVSATNGIAALFNLTTGAVAGSGSAGDGSGASATITTLANGWYRCTISGITSVAAHANAILRIALSNATTFSQSVDTSYAGDGTSGLTLWGAQAEVGGAFATSYIPTATTSATRAADNIGFVSQSWQTGNLGTYYGQLTALPGNASGRIWGASASSADIVGLAGNTQVEGFNGTQELTASAGSGGWSTGAKGAAAADVSGRSVCMNAGTVASDANGLGTLTTMFIGSNSGSNCANGYIGRVAYWKSRLAAVLLQNITT